MPATTEDSPAIRKLGQLFRLTEVYLWDDSYGAGPHHGQKNWRSAEGALVDSHTDKTCNEASNGTDKVGHSFVEDLELANLMGSLGLPVSFSTSKVNKNTGNKGKKKGRQAPLKAANTQINDAGRICANTEDRESTVESLDVMEHMHSCNLSGTPLGHNEPCIDDTDKMLREDSPCVEEQEESGCSTIYSADKAPGCDAKNQFTELGTFELSDNLGNPAKEEYSIQENQASDSVLLDSEEMSRHDCVGGESTHSCVGIYQEEIVSTREDQTSEETLSVPHDNNGVGREASLSLAEPSSIDEHAQNSANNFYYDYGEWRVVWDPFYSRYYFYNIQTQESTWYPPEGLEDFASYCSPDTTKELVELGSQCTSIALQENNLASDDNHLEAQEQDHCIHDLSDIPVEKPIYQSMITTSDKAQHTENKYSDSTTIVLEMNQEVASTKKKERIIHAKTWQGTSPVTSSNTGLSGVMIDCFTGVGGNAIQFATKCKHVIAVDIDPQKIDCAHNNASIYGVNDRIDFIVGDFVHIAPHLKGETAFMSPPWGGPDYAKVDVYDMKSMLMPCDGYSLFKLGTMIASRVVMFLPRNIDLTQLADMSLSVDPPWAVEVEKNFLNGKLKAITAYFEEQDG
ncbi:uncharacterized protein [Miscanthus floridulus]|uniref:uncharacterized protein isoform X3 n=1 Tax=Miscanthus floridulus TaxID=154761 RepID=UPI0034591E27